VALLAPAVVGVPWAVLTAGTGLPAPLPAAAGAVLLLLVVTTTATDLRWRWVPNWATYTATAWGLALAAVGSAIGAGSLFAAVSAADALAGFAAGFGLMLLLYAVFQGGAGDVKLVAALGALVGIDRVVHLVVYGYVLAAVAGACYLVWVIGPVGLLRELGRGLGLSRGPVGPGGPAPLATRVPMAPFLNAGAVLAVFWRGF
jgi:prepilin peptidase CpaA